MRTKQVLARQIARLVKPMGQRVAAERCKTQQSQISLVVNGHLRGFSQERLMSMLTALGQDVLISVRPSVTHAKRGRVMAHAA